MANGQVVAECAQRLWQVDPYPLPPSSTSQSTTFRGYTYTTFPTHPPGVLVRAIGAASQMGLAVWMPWPSSPTLRHPQSLYYLFIPPLGSMQFQWRLMVASNMFMKPILHLVCNGSHKWKSCASHTSLSELVNWQNWRIQISSKAICTVLWTACTSYNSPPTGI